MPGRLALRVEGDFWNAYYALPTTMVGAVLLGSLHLKVAADPRRRQAFQDLMTEVVGDMIEVATGVRPSFNVGRAPEHERAGRS